MNVSGNVTFYAGAKANTQTKDTRMEETKKKGLEKRVRLRDAQSLKISA